MKKKYNLATFICLLAMFATMFASCHKDDDDDEGSTDPSTHSLKKDFRCNRRKSFFIFLKKIPTFVVEKIKDMPDNNAKYPLTDTQMAVYAYCRANPDTAAYQICIKIGPYPGLDTSRLKHAAEAAIDRHPILKVSIENGPLMQRHDDEPPIVDIIDSETDFRNTVSMLGRLYNVAVFNGAKGCGIIICVHHLIFDGYSMNILVGEISAAYLGGKIVQEKKTFFDVVNDEINIKKSTAYKTAKQYFKQHFPTVSSRTVPPTDCDGKLPKPTFLKRKLPISLNRWAEICDALHNTGNVVSITAFAMVLGCFCGEDEARFSTVFHGRHGRDVAKTVGMFVKTIPVSASWRRDCKISDIMLAIRWQLARSMVNDIYPFSEIRKDCGGFGDVSFIYQGNTKHTAQFCGKKMVAEFLTPSFTGSSLSMELWHGDGFLELATEYDASKYSAQLVENMIDAFSVALQAIETAQTVGEISFLSPPTLAKLDSFNGNAVAPDCDDILEMFAEIVKKHPSAVAVRYLDKSLTYSELNEASDIYAERLKNNGVSAGQYFAVKATRDLMMVAMPLAVLKTGAAYVPQSPDYPEDFLNRQMEICNARKPLTDNGFAVFFTSGSTGTPKGVKVSRRNVAAYCRWYHRYFKPATGTMIAAYNDFAFDAFITDVFPALTCGATVAIVPKEIKKDLAALARFCDDNNVNIIDLPTQIGRIFAANKRCKTLRHIVLGGEAAAPFQNIGNYQIYNQYGPTETTVAATIYEIHGDESTIPIGHPLDSVKIYVVDGFGRRVPVGAIGEIWIAGPQVSDGYLDESDNANKFIINPFDSNPDFCRVFRTGDYGRWRDDGNLDFHGRRDYLVKIRGFRIEIGEIEAELRRCDGVVDAAAGTFPDAAGALQISAYVVGNQRLDIQKIRSELARKLPPQMLPQTLQQIPALPTKPNGKIDRNRLPKPICQPLPSAVSKPLSTLETAICQAFAEVLNIDEACADANFFEIGGTSISAMQVIVNLENRGIKIPYAAIFEHPTARGLAQYQNVDDKKPVHIPDALPNENQQDFDIPTTIVLTGATGFFGAHLLMQFIDNQQCKIHCIVRSKDGETARERLNRIYDHYFGRELPDSVSVIDGDLENPNFINDFEKITDENTTVVNCAAIVKYFANPQLMQAVNVDAVKYLTDLCLRHGWGFVQISTLSVEKATFAAVPYVKSKLKAEEIALAAAAKGLKLKIIRLGNLDARSTEGVFQINPDDNATALLSRAVRRLGCIPQPLENQIIDYTPVDVAAQRAASFINDIQSPIIQRVAPVRQYSLNHIKKVPTDEFLRRLEELPEEMRLPMQLFIKNLGYYSV